MQLSPAQIIKLAEDGLTALEPLAAAVKAGKAALDDHNHTKGATRVNTGPMQVVYGSILTIAEQLKKHIAENTPVAPKPGEAGPAAE